MGKSKKLIIGNWLLPITRGLFPIASSPWPIAYGPLPLTCFYTFPSFFNFLASFFSLRDLPGFFLLSFFTSLDFDMFPSSLSPPGEWFSVSYQNSKRLCLCHFLVPLHNVSQGPQSVIYRVMVREYLCYVGLDDDNITALSITFCIFPPGRHYLNHILQADLDLLAFSSCCSFF